MFLVSFSYSVFKYPYKIKVGRDLTNDPTSTLPTDWKRSRGQSREVATPGAHHKQQAVQGSSPGLVPLDPVTTILTEEDRKTRWAEGIALGHNTGFGAKPGLSHPDL